MIATLMERHLPLMPNLPVHPSGAAQRPHGRTRPPWGRWAGVLALLAVALSAPAASFFTDFNSGLPVGASVYGNSSIVASGGYTNSGYLQLTAAVTSQNGGFVITNDLDNGDPVYGFTAQFKAYMGGGNAADGISFNFAPDLPFSTITEDGAGTGLSVEFDTFSNSATDEVGIDVRANGGIVLTQPFSGLRPGVWVDVTIQLHPDATLDVYYDGFHAYTNVYTGLVLPFSAGHFGFGARTGGSDDNQWIDNLSLTTYTNQPAFVDYYYPYGRAVRADAPLEIVLTDYVTAVDTNTLVLKLNGTTVVPTVVTQAPPQTMIYYYPPPTALYAGGSSNTVTLTYADNANPTPGTTTFTYGFTAATYGTLTNPAAPALVSPNPGFNLRISQIDANLGPTLQRAESQLANLLIDPSTGLPFANQATVASFAEPAVINYSTQGGQGDFATEPANSIPGLPGALPDTTPTGDTNAAMEVVTYLYLPVGLHTLGVNSSDGFRLSLGASPDIFTPAAMAYDGVRAAADNTISFAVTNAGYYPFRLLYFVGGLELVNPTTDNPSLEFFSVDALGNKTLINDTTAPAYVAAYRPAVTLPYVRSVNPAPASTAVPHTSSLDATLVDGSLGVMTNTINLWLNGTAVSPTISSNAGLTTVHFQPASLALNSSNWVQLAFTDAGANRRTNVWSFVVENILQQLWTIPPAATSGDANWPKWVTTGSTERGLAYNPKTGHVLLVSRSAVTGGPGAKGGIAILDGTTGAFLGTMDVSLSTASGVGTYILNMIGVTEDGVIYVCNLTVSGGTALQVYRWSSETNAQQLVWNANPLGGRCGDDFRIQGSGAGTRILVSGNATTNALPLLTTADGTNFTSTLISVSGLGTLPTGGFFRLGLAFGCGDTFYGQTTGYPLKYCAFNEPPSTVGALLTSYGIVAYDSTLSLGPIGVDLMNQRLIGDETSGGTGTTHSMNLYDLSTFTTSGNNNPIDHKVFATSTGSFGTGSVDFTPDGTRVYTLDTANGIIAFSLSPKIGAPVICAQPRTNIVAGVGATGFLDVRAVGAPQKYQWRFSATSPTVPGTPVLNATNRTLDLYNVQLNQLGFYSVVITNASLLTSVTSAVAVLDTLMVVTNQPASQMVAVGASATFTVGVSNGAPPFTYQWQHNGANVGVSASSYTASNAQASDGGAYQVIITDSLGQSVSSAAASLIVGSAGTGDGLRGDYYNQLAFIGPPATPFTGPPAFSHVDPTVNFNWGTGSPDPTVNPDYFTARWSGKVQPFATQTHTLYIKSDDGSQLWVDGQLVVTNWATQGATERSGTIALNGGQLYDIVMEYYEQTGGAVAQLSWSSPYLVKQIIPQTQLYAAAASPATPTLSVRQTDGTHISLAWSGSYVLLSAPAVTGPWSPVSGATTPYVITTMGGSQMFFRLVSN